MADNIQLSSAVGIGSVLRTDDDATAHWQYVKLAWGADGTQTIVTAAAGVPVQPGTSTTWVLGAGAALVGKVGIDQTTPGTTNAVAPISGQAGVAGGAGAVGATVQRVTLASDDPAVVDLAAIEVLLGTMDADTGAIKTAIELLDNALYVDDAAWTDSTSSHLLVGGLYQSSPQTITDGDVGPFQVTANGYQIVSVNGTVTVGSHAVTNAGTFVVQVDGNALTALQLIDDTVAVLGTATYAETTTKGNIVAAVRNDDLATLANTDNKIAPLQVNSAGALYTEPAAQVDYVFDGSAKCTVKRASGVAASGTTAIVAAVASKKIRILALFLKATSATVTNVYLATTTDTDVLGNAGNPIPLAVDADGDNDSGFALNWNPGGWTETSTANEDLNLILSAAQDVIWCLTYIEVS